jgi:hypothetical protein
MGSPHPKGRRLYTATSEAEAPLLVLLFVFTIFIVGFSAGETHVTFIDAIFTEILLARYTLNQFVGLNFRPT